MAARARALVTAHTASVAVILACAGALLAGCGTGPPPPISSGNLAEAQTFPYFRVYWVGRNFEGNHLAAVDGLKNYLATVGDSVYYGDCVQKKGIFGGGSCALPLQVTTGVYKLHSNKYLGPQSNALVRGVPAVLYNGGRTIEIYTGRVAVDVYSDTFEHAWAAAQKLLPVNADGSSSGPLPPPVYCPALFGPQPAELEAVMRSLPGQACQKAAANEAFTNAVRGQ